MKLHTPLLLASAIAATASFASAVDCKPEEEKAIDTQDAKAFGVSCPALFSNGVNVLTPSPSTTMDMLKEIEGCKASTCTAFLTQVAEKTPDCEIDGVNAKGKYSTILELCKKFAAGPVSDEDLQKSYADLLKYSDYELIESSGAGEEEAIANGTDSTTPAPSTTASNSSTSAPATAGSDAATYFTGIATVALIAVVSTVVA